MNITSYHLKIISCLKKNLYTFEELARILNGSISRVRKAVLDLEYILKVKGLLELYDKVNTNNFNEEKIKEIQSYTPEERKIYIVLKLFETDRLNLSKIGKDLDITRRTVFNDIISLKKRLKEFQLTLENSSKDGIYLNGMESDKRNFYNLYMIKLFLEIKYLPIKLKEYVGDIKKINKEYKISELVQNILKISEIWPHTIVIIYLEITIFIAIKRKNFIDSSLNVENDLLKEHFEDYLKEIKELVENLKYFTNFEKNQILEFCYKRQERNFYITNKKILEKVYNLISYMNLNLKYYLILDDIVIMQLVTILSIMEFKSHYNIEEIYIFNKKISEDYKKELDRFSDVLKKFFKTIDSYDLIILSSIFLNVKKLESQDKAKKSEHIVIVYNTLHKSFINEVCKKLGLESITNNLKLISIHHLENYLEKNKVKGIIVFEDLELGNIDSKIKVLNYLLPITEVDKLKLLNFI